MIKRIGYEMILHINYKTHPTWIVFKNYVKVYDLACLFQHIHLPLIRINVLGKKADFDNTPFSAESPLQYMCDVLYSFPALFRLRAGLDESTCCKGSNKECQKI